MQQASAFERLVTRTPGLLALVDRRGMFTCLSPSWEQTLGFTREELVRDPYLALVHPEDLEETCNELGHMASGMPYSGSHERRLRHRDGSYRWLHWQCNWDGNEMTVAALDITDRKLREHEVLHDPLTGLASRALGIDRLSAAIGRLERVGGVVLALLVDVDDLTSVNDHQGYASGDQVLRTVGARLGERMRASDTVARLGGDRFLVIADDIAEAAPHSIETVIERVSGVFARPIRTRHALVQLSGSIGVAVARDARADPERLLQDADAALARVKEKGRGGAEVFDGALAEEVKARIEIASELRGALQRGEFHVVFQPLVCVESGVPIGCEALLRWRHPERGELPPGQFLRIAEDDGLIVPIGAWVLEQSCRQLAEWEAEGRDMTVSVNVSARQLSQPDFVAVVERVLHQTGVPPEKICLEITETSILRRPELAAQSLAALRRLGVRVALDDFGLGYSSLAHLKELPIDVVKVDRSFVADVCRSDEDLAVVEAVLTLARRMGLTVVAEGVETADQDQLLRQLGCPIVQGYLYGRPVPAASIPASDEFETIPGTDEDCTGCSHAPEDHGRRQRVDAA